MNSLTLRRVAAGAAIFGMLCVNIGAIANAESGPSVTLSTPLSSPTGVSSIPIIATFSSAVTGVAATQFNVGNGTIQNFSSVSSTTYTFTVIPTAGGSISVDYNGGQVSDASGNTNLAASQLQIIYDPSLASSTASTTSSGGGTSTSSSTSSGAPSLSITSGPDEGSTVSTSTVTFTFVTDGDATTACMFGSTSINYLCGSPQTFSGLGDSDYVFSVTATNSSASTTVTRHFTVLAATSTDATSTPSEATSTPTTTPEPTTNTGGGSSTSAASNQNIGNGPPVGSIGSGSSAGLEIHTVIPTVANSEVVTPGIPNTGVSSNTSLNTSPSVTVIPIMSSVPPTQTSKVSSNSGNTKVAVTAKTTTSANSSTGPGTVAKLTATGAGASSSLASTSSTTIGIPNTGVAATAASNSAIPLWGWVAIGILVVAGIVWWLFSAATI